MWFDYQNKLMQDKRRDEELKQTVKEWSDARGRVEGEIARRKEHTNFGTNFEQARGFVRKNWKTKNFDPDENPLEDLDSTDEEDYGNEEEEAEDEVEEHLDMQKQQPDLEADESAVDIKEDLDETIN